MNNKQQQILKATLSNVPALGWTDTAYRSALKACGYLPLDGDRLFPSGIADIVLAFDEMIEAEMDAKIKGKRNFPGMRVRDKIAFALRARLEALSPYHEATKRLITWSILPQNVQFSAQRIWKTADRIWLAAGDTSTDYNYYTKRFLLIAVLKAVMISWLNDESKDHADTWSFLDRRIEDIMKVGKGIGLAKAVGISDIVSFLKGRLAN